MPDWNTYSLTKGTGVTPKRLDQESVIDRILRGEPVSKAIEELNFWREMA